MLNHVTSLLYEFFAPLLSCFLYHFWHEWPKVLLIGWLSGQVGLSHLNFEVVWVPRYSLSSNSSG